MFYKRLCVQWENEADEAIAELERQRAATQRARPQLHASVRGIGGRGGSPIAMSLVMSQSPLTLGNICHTWPDSTYGERMGTYYRGFVVEEARALGFTWDDLRTWKPATAAKQRGRRRSAG